MCVYIFHMSMCIYMWICSCTSLNAWMHTYVLFNMCAYIYSVYKRNSFKNSLWKLKILTLAVLYRNTSYLWLQLQIVWYLHTIIYQVSIQVLAKHALICLDQATVVSDYLTRKKGISTESLDNQLQFSVYHECQYLKEFSNDCLKPYFSLVNVLYI